MAASKRGDLAEFGRERLEASVAPEPFDGAQLGAGGAACTPDVGVVGVCQPVGPGARRSDDRRLLQAKCGFVRAEDSEELGHRLQSLDVGEGMAAARTDFQLEAFESGELCEELGAGGVGGAKLEMRVTWTADRSGREERTSQVRNAAAGSAHDAARRAIERRQPGPEDPRLVQSLEDERIVV